MFHASQGRPSRERCFRRWVEGLVLLARPPWRRCVKRSALLAARAQGASPGTTPARTLSQRALPIPHRGCKPAPSPGDRTLTALPRTATPRCTNTQTLCWRSAAP
eukprot:scaffold17235_cov66-Phaeocystis_antarctica.AAC.3